MLELRAYNDADYGACMDLLEAAFADDPKLDIFAIRSRHRCLKRCMKAAMSIVVPENHVVVAHGEDVIHGMIALIPPGRYPYPVLRSIRITANLVTGLPLISTLRLIWASTLADWSHPRTRHWYVALLAVHPSAQRQGIGKQLLSQALSKATNDRLPVYLETTTEANVSYYSRFGFQVSASHRSGITPAFWGMRKNP